MYFGFSKEPGIKSIAKICKADDISLDKKKDNNKRQKNETMIDLKSSDNINELMQELVINDDELKLVPLMVMHDGDCPNRVYISGQSYCGKSYCAAQLCQDFNQVFPKAKVAYISYNEDDKSCNDKNIDNFLKINVDENIMQDPLTLDEFHDKCVVFDDIEAFGDPRIIKELENFMIKCINTGRHKSIATIVCRQKLLDGHRSSSILNGVHQLISFPHSGSRFQLRNYLDRYLHLPKKKIEKILNVPSRWVLLNLVNPMYCLHEKGGFIL